MGAFCQCFIYLCIIIGIHLFFITRPENHLRTKKQLINLLYNMKKLTSILNCSKYIKIISLRNVGKALSVEDNRLLHNLPESHLHTNKHFINLHYNDVKYLPSILNC